MLAMSAKQQFNVYLPADLVRRVKHAAVDADRSPGLARAGAFGQVLEHGDGRLGGRVGAEECRALALGEVGLARLAIEEADVVVLAVAAAGGEVARVAGS